MDNRDNYTKAFDQFTAILDNTEYGRQLLENIKNDPRSKILENCLINTGRGCFGYHHKELALWYLWAVERKGESEADVGLNTFLNSNTYPVLNTMWIVGVEADSTIELVNGLKILPVGEMPESLETEAYSTTKRLTHNNPTSIIKPKVAIVKECYIQRNFDISEDMKNIGKSNMDFWESSRILEDTALILNAMHETSCIPYYSTSYSLPNMPFGFFLGGGGTTNNHDAIGFGSTKLHQNCTNDINLAITGFNRLDEQDKAHYRISLSRLSQSKRKHIQKIEDKILDLCIALEMVLLIDNQKPYSKNFRERGSRLISINDADRLEKEQDLKDIYNYRSQVAHTGVLCNGNVEEIRVVHDNFKKYCIIAESIIRKLITDGQPSWTS